MLFFTYLCRRCSETSATVGWLMMSSIPVRDNRCFVLLNVSACVHYWDAQSGENDALTGKGHTNSVVRLTADDSYRLVSCSMDDTVRFSDLKKKEYR